MNQKVFTLSYLAQLVQGRLEGNGEVTISGVAPLDSAKKGELSFVRHKKYLKSLANCNASALIVSDDISEEINNIPLIVVKNPEVAFAKIAWLFYENPVFPNRVHTNAVLSETAKISETCYIGPFVHVCEEAEIGSGTIIMSGAYIGRKVKIGEDCIIYPRVVVLDGCVLGNRIIVHAGTVIGSDGFGYVSDSNGNHIKIPQMGNVVIEDDVEIGANSTIDRATFGSTLIKKGTKIDNLVHIAHNVQVGESCIMAGQVGIAGSCQIGNHVIMAGQVGVADHTKVGDRVRIGAKAGVATSIPSGLDVIGIPAHQRNEYLKMYMNVKRIEKIKKDLEEVKKQIKNLK